MALNTAFLLMAQYQGRAIIPIDDVQRDYFSHLSVEKLLRKIASGEIRLPLVRTDNSQKSAKGIHLGDLAEYLDHCRETALRDYKDL